VGAEDWFDGDEVDDAPEDAPPPAGILDAVGQLAAAVVLVFVLGLIAVGAVAVVSWVMR